MIEHKALELAIKTAQDAVRKPIVHCDKLPRHDYYRQLPDGTLVLEESPREPLSYQVEDLSDFAKAVKQFRDGKATVFCGPGSIEAVLDEGEKGRERLHFGLCHTSEFLTLKRLAANRHGLQQGEFLNLLRIDLAQCVSPDVITQLRAVKFKKSSEGIAKVEHGNQAISTGIKQSIMLEAGAPPEEICVTLRVYVELPETRLVRCAVDLDVEAMAFRLIPLSGELDTAEREVQCNTRDQLRELLGEAAEVYCGQC